MEYGINEISLRLPRQSGRIKQVLKKPKKKLTNPVAILPRHASCVFSIYISSD